MKLKELIKELNLKSISIEEYNILEYALVLEEIDNINQNEILSEGVLDMVVGKLDGVATKLKNMGFEFHNTKPGLIKVLEGAGKTVLKAFFLGLAATKAKAMKDLDKLEIITADMKAISEDVKLAFTKENVVDFLMQLDQATAHLITGPIHMFNALTGVHIVLPWESKEAVHAGHEEHDEHNNKNVGISEIISATIVSLKDKISKILNPDKAGEVSVALDKIMYTVVSASKAA